MQMWSVQSVQCSVFSVQVFSVEGGERKCQSHQAACDEFHISFCEYFATLNTCIEYTRILYGVSVVLTWRIPFLNAIRVDLRLINVAVLG